jgi:hypothetical protein
MRVFRLNGTTMQCYRSTMKIDSLEKEVLRLPPEERARLAELLLSSLDELPESELERIEDDIGRSRRGNPFKFLN